MENSQVVIKYIDESQYETEVRRLCSEQIEGKWVLERLQEEFINDVLDERPEVSEFERSEVLSQYINDTTSIRNDVDERLKNHLLMKII